MIEMGEKKLNRDVIKYAAVFAMLLNHMAHVFLREGSWEYEICVAVGYFTAVTMCYFLVEGYQYTRSKKKYGQRLLLFAMISQVPYQAALGIRQLNMLFTLLFCFLILVCLEYIQDSAERSVCVCLLAAATCICDWGGLAAAFTVLFAQAYGSRRKLLYAYGVDYLLFSLVSAVEYAKKAFVGACSPARIAGRSRNSGFWRGDRIFLQRKKNRHRRPVLEMVFLCVLSDASLCIVGHQYFIFLRMSQKSKVAK